MRVECYQCNAVYEIPVEKLGPGGVRAECPRCEHQQTVRREQTDPGKKSDADKAAQDAAAEASQDADRDSLFDFSNASPRAEPPPIPKAPAAGSASAPGVASAGAQAAAAAQPAPDPFDDDPFADISDEPFEAPVDDLLDEMARPAARAEPASAPPAAPPPAAPPEARGASPSAERPPGFDGGDPFSMLSQQDAPGSAEPEGGGAAQDNPFGAPGEAASLDDAAPAPVKPSPPRPDAVDEGASGGAQYRVKKPNGSILGPFSLAQLEGMAERGEVAPGDQLARDADEFRLLSQYEECAPLLEKSARRTRAKTGRPVYRTPPSRRWPKVLGAVVVLAVAGAATVWFVLPDVVPEPIRETIDATLARMTGGSEEPVQNPVHADLGLFRLQVVDLEGTATEHLARAEALMVDDSPASYDAADLALKRALLLDPDDPVAVGRFLVNSVLLRRWEADPGSVQRFIAYGRYLEQVAPDEPVSLQGQAVVQVLLGGERAAEARRLARRAVDARPDDPMGILVLGRATAGVDHRAAIAKLTDWVKRDDAPVRIHLELAHACRLAGDFGCADAALRRRLAHTPDHEEAIASLVALHVLVGAYEEAKSLYEALLEREPDRADAALALALLEYQLAGEVSQARRRVDAAIANRIEDIGDPIDRRLRVHGATLARLEGATARAEALLAEVFEHDPHDGPANYQAVLLALAADKPEEAAARLPAAVASIDHPARRALLRALVHAARDNTEDAVREARRAMDAWPDALEPVLLAAALEGRRGQNRQAYLLLRQSLNRDPTEAHRNRNLTEYWDGRELERTLVAGFEALVERDPRQGMAHAAHGAGLWLAGDAARARAALRRALEFDERNFPAHVYLGVLAYDAGNLGAASASFERAAGIDGLSPLAWYLGGRVAERRDEVDEARVAYRDALRRDSAFYPAQIRLAVIDAAENGAGSRAILRRISVSRPDNVAARAALFEIGR